MGLAAAASAIGGGLAAIGGGSALAGAGLASGVLGAGASIVNGVMQSNAASDAAKAQTNANNQAIAEQQREFNVNQANLTPWLTAGQSALSQQMALLGLGSLSSTPVGSNAINSAAGAQALTPGGLTQAQAQQLLQDRPDVLAAYNLAVNGGVGANGQQVPAADPNSPAYAAAGLSSPEAYANHWYTQMGGNSSYQLPAANGNAAAGSSTLSAAQQQQQAIDALKNNPLYTSQYNNGVNTILANASATGGLRGGNSNASLANFGSQLLGSVYQQQLANLGSISGLGQNTGTNLGSLGNANSGVISNLLSQNGSANAGGVLSSAGALGGGINSGLSSLLNGIGQWSTLNGGPGAFPAYGGASNAANASQQVFNAGGGTFGSNSYNFEI